MEVVCERGAAQGICLPVYFAGKATLW